MRAHRLLCHDMPCRGPLLLLLRRYGTSALTALRASKPVVHVQPQRRISASPSSLSSCTSLTKPSRAANVMLTPPPSPPPPPPPSVKAHMNAAKASLLSFHPSLARTWLAAATNKMLQPQHVRPDSRKLVWWACPHCAHQFTRRIDLHVAAGGACPRCHARPELNTSSCEESARRVKRGRPRKTCPTHTVCVPPPVVHRCRPDNSLATLAAVNGNRVKKSVADGCYLRVAETRNLLPMLAKMYVKEARKIAAHEPLMVSPKLDGIRCVVAYDKARGGILFFSRSGILFECCDACIEPALQHAFARDPSLVLDGELYNDSANLSKLHALKRKQIRENPFLQLIHASSASHDAPTSCTLSATTTKTKAKKISKEIAKNNNSSNSIISFEQLVSAIRTTRERRTPAVAALQAQLQFHLFDVLYAAAFAPHGAGSAVSYDTRYSYLRTLLAELHAHNAAHLPRYDPRVLRLVPSWRCVKANVEAALQSATLLGYEGVMVRRLSTFSTSSRLPCTPAKNKKKNNKMKEDSLCRASSGELAGRMGVADGGYDYGQRSDCLLKYKLMQDDEFTIVAAVEGKGKWKGQLGAFLCATHDQRHTFSVAPASTDAEKRRMWRLWRAQYQGRALTVQYQELTPDGVPRFPVAKCVRGAPDGRDWI